MAKDPAMLFYTADFLVGVAFMSMEERGQYITLLCYQQQRGHLTRDEMEKAVGTLTPDVLEKFVQDEEGKYYNRRAEVEINKRQNYTNSRIKNFSHIESHMGDHMEKHMESHMENENENEIDNIKSETENAKRDNRGVGEKEEKKTRFTPPSIEEVAAYCAERQNGIDPQNFVDFYTSKGWKVGNQPMKDWRAAVRTWESKREARPQRPQTAKPQVKPASRSNVAFANASWERLRAEMGLDDGNEDNN